LILEYRSLDSLFPTAPFYWDAPLSFTSLAFEARAIVDGRPSSATAGIAAMTFGFNGTYWR